MPAHVWRNWRQAILRSLTHRLIVLPRMLWLRSFSGLSFIMNLILHHFLEERHICLQSTFCYSILHCSVVTFYQGWFEVFVWAEESHRLLLSRVIWIFTVLSSLHLWKTIIYLYPWEFYTCIQCNIILQFPTSHSQHVPLPTSCLFLFIYWFIYFKSQSVLPIYAQV